MPPPPPRTYAFTVAASGAASSRFGPVAPDVPGVRERVAAAAARREDLLAARRGRLEPAGSSAAASPRRRAAGPISSTATANAATSQVTRREHAVDGGQHQGDGIPLVVMNHSPLVTHVATSSANTVPPITGSHTPARPGIG